MAATTAALSGLSIPAAMASTNGGWVPAREPAGTGQAASNGGWVPAPEPAGAGQAAFSGQVRDGLPLQGKGAARIVVPNGLPRVAGAVVSIPRLGRQTTTNASGDFSFSGLRVSPGATYILVVRKRGFGTWRESGIRLIPGDPGQVYVELHSAEQNLRVVKSAQPANGPAGARVAVPGGCTHNSSGWTSQTKEPPSIRVYLTGSHTVHTYPFSFYEEHVLPNEWIPSWDEAALQAGAVAVRDYAWFFVVNGSKGTGSAADPCSFDVDDTTAYQNFRPGNPIYTSTTDAVASTAPYLFTAHSKIPELGYNSGNPGDKCGTETVPGSMDQWGTQSCAQDGYTWQQILAKYYPGDALTTPSPSPGAGVPSGPAVNDPLTGALEVYGTSSGHDLVEYYWAKGQGWQSFTVPGSAGLVTGRPSAVFDPLGNNLEVYAAGTNGKLQEFYYQPGKQWRSQQLPATPSPVTGNPSAVVDQIGKAVEVYATGADGKLEEDYWSPGKSWQAQELPAPPSKVTGSPSAVDDTLSNVLEVYATGTDGKLQEDYWAPRQGGWKTAEIAALFPLTGTPAAVDDPLGKNLEVYATGNDSKIEELYYRPGAGWRTQELPATTSPVTGSPTAVYDGLSKVLEVYATGTNGNLEEDYWATSQGGWKTAEQTGIPITPTPFAIDDTTGKHLEVYGLTTGSDLAQYYYAPGNGWKTQTIGGKWATL